ncbi:hypothetical protein DFJ73DRAFT_795250 [Zopfochytrium polystomum]|nr:hypothetical protein DFJ73DRAFT_795250 [Zopfochytrium polystomum]
MEQVGLCEPLPQPPTPFSPSPALASAPPTPSPSSSPAVSHRTNPLSHPHLPGTPLPLPPLPPSRTATPSPIATGSATRTSTESDNRVPSSPTAASNRPRRLFRKMSNSDFPADAPSSSATEPSFVTVSDDAANRAAFMPRPPLPMPSRQRNFQFSDAELSSRSRDEWFWKRLVIQEPPGASDLVDLIKERDSALVLASQCGLHILHSLYVMEAERESFHIQTESAHSALLEAKSLLAEKDAAVRSLENRIHAQFHQLRASDQRVRELTTELANLKRTAARLAASSTAEQAKLSDQAKSTDSPRSRESSVTRSPRMSALDEAEPEVSNNTASSPQLTEGPAVKVAELPPTPQESHLEEIKRLKLSEKRWHSKYKTVAARCVELNVELDKARDELSLFKETNRTLTPILTSRKSSSSLPRVARVAAIESAAAAAKTPPTTAPEQADGEELLSSSPPSSEVLLLLVRELALSRKKMRTEMEEVKSMLGNAQSEVANLSEKLEFLESESKFTGGDGDEGLKSKTIFSELEDYVADRSIKRLGTSFSSEPDAFSAIRVKESLPSVAGQPVPVRPEEVLSEDGWEVHSNFSGVDEPSPAAPVGKTGAPLPDESSHGPAGDYAAPNAPGVKSQSRRGSIGLASLPSSTQIYLRTLHSMAVTLHERLNATDTMNLNRMLRREFDLTELTRLSQSVISNVISDIKSLSSRFPATAEAPVYRQGRTGSIGKSAAKQIFNHNNNQPTHQTSVSQEDLTSTILPMVSLIQILLGDIAHLRSTLNDLSLAFYDRVMSQSKEVEKNLAAEEEIKKGGRRTLAHKLSFDRKEGGRSSSLEWFRGRTTTPPPTPQTVPGGEAPTQSWTSWKAWGGVGNPTSPPARSTSVDDRPIRASLTRSQSLSTPSGSRLNSQSGDVETDRPATSDDPLFSPPLSGSATIVSPTPVSGSVGPSSPASVRSRSLTARKSEDGDRPKDGWGSVAELFGGRAVQRTSNNNSQAMPPHPHLPQPQQQQHAAVAGAEETRGRQGMPQRREPINFSAFGEAWQMWGTTRWGH